MSAPKHKIKGGDWFYIIIYHREIQYMDIFLAKALSWSIQKDRKIIKMLSKDACSVLNSDLSSSVRSVCNSVIQNYYTKFKIVKVFLRRIVLFLVIFVLLLLLLELIICEIHFVLL